MLASELSAARMARDLAAAEKGKLIEEVGTLRVANMEAHAEHKKEEALRAAEAAYLRSQASPPDWLQRWVYKSGVERGAILNLKELLPPGLV